MTSTSTSESLVPSPTFGCTTDIYIVRDYRTLYRFDLATGIGIKAVDFDLPGDYNSIGYHPTEDVLYGTRDDRQVVRIFEDGRTEDVVNLTPAIYIGATFDSDGNFWAFGQVRANGARYYVRKVDLRPGSATYGKVVEERRTDAISGMRNFFNDWAYTPASPEFLYALGRDAEDEATAVLYRFKLAKGELGWEKVYETKLDKPFSDWAGMMGDSEGSVYGIQTNSGNIYKFPVDDRNGVEFLAHTPGKDVNDMARCHNAPAVA
ncbi:hypothetical protein NLG97_g6052 [Lecanicillium saksenae]|uniref:Uncharacterized protein n=1 Tax=Lecanicillium saksenae TaxID=468837 RepID=A0ACC1QT37_9HYPO|nr:hypothetical protein NLG97_g6052 [Lecanicillium saksenae]